MLASKILWIFKPLIWLIRTTLYFPHHSMLVLWKILISLFVFRYCLHTTHSLIVLSSDRNCSVVSRVSALSDYNWLFYSKIVWVPSSAIALFRFCVKKSQYIWTLRYFVFHCYLLNNFDWTKLEIFIN